MPGMGGRFGTKLPPPAAMTMTGATRTLPVSVVSRHLPSWVLSSDAAISPKWKVGSNGLICSSSRSVSSWPVQTGTLGMS